MGTGGQAIDITLKSVGTVWGHTEGTLGAGTPIGAAVTACPHGDAS